MYRLSKDEYSNLLQNAIASKYKKTDKRTAANINKEGIKHAREVNVIDRIEINDTGSSFITLKDRKENFINRPSTRLLKKRKRNIIWFDPPYSKSVKTNIGRIFIKLISKHFPPNHKFVKIFNKNTIKLSYSCMPNIRSKINGHNKKNTGTQTRRATEIMQLPC